MAQRDAYGPIDGELTDSAGTRFRDLRVTLTPRYRLAWLQIGLGHVALAAVVLLAAQAQTLAQHALAAVLGALAVGYAMGYVQLFFHEAAHFLLARDRGTNDLLANLFIGMWIGQDIRKYRPIHFGHHRDIGHAEDTERTYFEALTATFIVKSLFGIRLVEVLLLRRRALQAATAKSGEGGAKPVPGSRWPLLMGLTVHASILAALALTQSWGAALAWLAGMGTVYPFIASIRQLLEHRALPPGGAAPLPYAAAHRMFGDGLFASTFGGAGFNRHLLHHMEPQISYTRLPEVEQFLIATDRASWLSEHRTSYGRSFVELLAQTKPASAPITSP